MWKNLTEKITNSKPEVEESYPPQDSMYDGGQAAFDALGLKNRRPGDPDLGSNSADVKAEGAAG